MLITVEDASIMGGLGGAVAELVAEKYPVIVRRVGVKDQFGESGKSHEIKDHFGLNARGICDAVRTALAAAK